MKKALRLICVTLSCRAIVDAGLGGPLKRRIARALEHVDIDNVENEAASSSDAPRGSLRRRMERASNSGPSGDGHDAPLVASLRRAWAAGKISSPMVQEFALAAAQQGAHGGGVDRIARAGASGSHAPNIQRAILNFFGFPDCVPAFKWVPLPMARGSVLHPVILSHELFGKLYHERRSYWNQHIRGPPQAAEEFWRRLSHSSIVRDHPALSSTHLTRTLPIGLHGDGGAFSKQDSLFVISWNSILGNLDGSGFSKRFIFTIIRKRDMTQATLPALWKIFGWSCNSLLSGITPQFDWLQQAMTGGEYIAERYRAALVQLRGDWEFYVLFSWGFPTGRVPIQCVGYAQLPMSSRI